MSAVDWRALCGHGRAMSDDCPSCTAEVAGILSRARAAIEPKPLVPPRVVRHGVVQLLVHPSRMSRAGHH